MLYGGLPLNYGGAMWTVLMFTFRFASDKYLRMTTVCLSQTRNLARLQSFDLDGSNSSIYRTSDSQKESPTLYVKITFMQIVEKVSLINACLPLPMLNRK